MYIRLFPEKIIDKIWFVKFQISIHQTILVACYSIPKHSVIKQNKNGLEGFSKEKVVVGIVCLH